VTRHGEERLHQVRQRPQAPGDHARFPREAEKVFDDQAEALAPEPAERLKVHVMGGLGAG
jgi:hypothetical protein